MNVIVMLADYAAVTEGKLTLVGGGWSFVGPQIGPIALAILVEVPWGDTNLAHQFLVELQDEDGKPALIGPEAGVFRIEGQLEVGRPPGHPQGTPFNVPMGINLPPLPLTPGRRYIWVVSIDGQTQDHWRAGFNVRPAAPPV